jgi:hypothetical protein
LELRFYIDPETGAPHFERHGITEREVRGVMARPMEDSPAREGARMAVGRAPSGRYARVIYVPDPQPDSAFVISAYELGPKAKHALRRRRRTRP